MLQTIAGAIDVHVELANIVTGVIHLKGFAELKHASKGLPWGLCLEPFKVVLGVCCASVDYFFHFFSVGSTLIQWQLVFTPLVRKVHFKPVKAIITDSLSFRER